MAVCVGWRLLIEAGSRGEYGWCGLIRVGLMLKWRLGLHVNVLTYTIAYSVLTSNYGRVNCSFK